MANKEQYITIAEFAEKAGVNRTYVYKLLDNKLKPFCIKVDNKQMLKIQALELFNVSKVDTEETDTDTLKELIEILQEQQATLKAELKIKNQQIEAQLKEMGEYSERLKESHYLIAQQQKNEQKLLETASQPQEKPKQESLLNPHKFSTEAEYSQYLLKLLPRIGMFSTRKDRQELEKILELMSEEEKELIYQEKAYREAIEHIRQDTALAVMDCRETATSREDFIDQMKARGYGVDWKDSHKYITFTDLERQSQGEKQCKVRNNKLEKYYAVDFGKESLEHGFEINARREAERTATTERARQQLDRTAVAENSGADERARARQLLDRTAVAEDSRTGKAYQPDNTAVTEERLSNLRSYQPSRGMESQGRPGTDQGKRPGTETTGRTTEPQKDLAEERLASLRSHKPSRGMEEPSREIGDTDTETLIREARAGIDSSRTREENSGADRANREAERSRQRAEAQRRAEEAKREAEARQAQRRARSRSYGIER